MVNKRYWTMFSWPAQQLSAYGYIPLFRTVFPEGVLSGTTYYKILYFYRGPDGLVDGPVLKHEKKTA